jgi:hypothetical protein
MSDSTFDKTNKGREEIATRKYHLTPRLRTLLLLFDGKRTSDEVLQKVAGIGLTEQNITELLHGGFIHDAVEANPVAMSLMPATHAAADPVVLSNTEVRENQMAAVQDASVLRALYDFYTETIRSAVGLRGYALQLKVERARSIDDFRKMRVDYLNAVIKAQGEQVAQELDQRLLLLLQHNNPAGAER